MKSEKSLFDDDTADGTSTGMSDYRAKKIHKEVPPLDRLRNLEEKITSAVERVKALKEEKTLLEKKIKDLEMMLNEKNREIEALRTEKSSIGHQLEELLRELDSLEV